MENLYLLDKKKFDIRQWVIVTCLCPLTIWMYEENYVRICVDQYDEAEISNKFAHLTNNSIQKLGAHFSENAEKSMISQQDFRDYLSVISSSRRSQLDAPQHPSLIYYIPSSLTLTEVGDLALID